MRSSHDRESLFRHGRFELFEERLALSAHPIGTLLPDAATDPQLEQHYEELTPLNPAGDFQLDADISQIAHHANTLQPLLSDVHQMTGVHYVHHEYGYDGSGQTVAIIDSGIAYDHLALGAGYGANHRVVGGYDFAENDADPYDDGPAGFHGTHVAGIVGSDDQQFVGVAPGADLVALRVFDDDGAGYFNWVEDALSWVHDHQNDFANPITTVNLSLGTDWNDSAIPAWAMLEDEFAQLEAAGIFIAVSAGNSFQDFGEAGVSYPAASPYVVPVSSVDNNGQLSDFSQRDGQVLAAPGRSITSSVPDHIFGSDGNPNDFGTASGTSMAAPYVAGASMLVRQAMQTWGYQSITQDTIYDHLRATADTIFDSVTAATYHRINVRSAIDALQPTDDFGSTAADAHDLGDLQTVLTVAGTINTLDDHDFFRFTAGDTGTVSWQTAEMQPGLNVQLVGRQATTGPGRLSFDVVAGQNYTLDLSNIQSTGDYVGELQLTSTVEDLDAINFLELGSEQVNAEGTLYRIQAARSGILTVIAATQAGTGHLQLEVSDAAMNRLPSSQSFDNGSSRMDANVAANQTVYLRISGFDGSVSLSLANLVSQSGDRMTMVGTAENDDFRLDQETGVAEVNGIRYVLGADIRQVRIDASGGNDVLRWNGTSSRDVVTTRGISFEAQSADLSVQVESIEAILADGRGGDDAATMYDRPSDDLLIASPERVQLVGSGFTNDLRNFELVNAIAGVGHDRAVFTDSAGNDLLGVNDVYGVLRGNGFYNRAEGFDEFTAYATSGGFDRAFLYDSAGNDTLGMNPFYSVLRGDGFYNRVDGFDEVSASARSGGVDRAYLYDSTGQDIVGLSPTHSTIRGDAYRNQASNFESVLAYARSGGYDTAYFYDSSGNDVFESSSQISILRGSGFHNAARGFDRVQAQAREGGFDRAVFYEADGDRLVDSSTNFSRLQGQQTETLASNFEQLEAYRRDDVNAAVFEALDEETANAPHRSSVLARWNRGGDDVEAVDYLFFTEGES